MIETAHAMRMTALSMRHRPVSGAGGVPVGDARPVDFFVQGIFANVHEGVTEHDQCQ